MYFTISKSRLIICLLEYLLNCITIKLQYNCFINVLYNIKEPPAENYLLWDREETRWALWIPISAKNGPFRQPGSTRKKSPVLNCEQLFSSVFSTFHGQKIYFSNCSVRTKKLLDRKVINNWKKIRKNFFGCKTVFLGLAALVYFELIIT